MAWTGPFEIAGSLLLAPSAMLFVYYCWKIHWNAPQTMKFFSRLLLVGAICVGVLSSLMFIIGVDKEIPGSDGLVFALGAFIIGFVIVSEPKLAYILPFKALRITVIDFGKGGLPLFTYTWNLGEHLTDEALFSGMLTGISSILKESLQRGNVREIHLDTAVLIVQRSSQLPVACVLVTTKSSPSLKQSLNSFAISFFAEFSHQILNSELVDLQAYAPASRLVERFFPFVPEYGD
ncbi:MAG: hypothetical protein ACFFGZ_14955 [Candidatus Thorarchaeota archaeon]